MNVIHEARSILEKANYQTHAQNLSSDVFYFEDFSILGFVKVCETIESLINGWESSQDSFLKEHALRLRSEPNKAWNVYSVFLSTQECPDHKKSKLFEIEEDFRGARKIARAGIKTRQDLQLSLLPLLPMKNLMSLKTEDVEERLRKRLSPDGDSPLLELIGQKTAEELARILKGQ